MRLSRIRRLLLAGAGMAGLLLVSATGVGAAYHCTTTYFEDDTCDTVCIYWDSQGRPAGYMRCRCC
jgi:hypothetical protein